MSWIKGGCLIQVTSGSGLQNIHNRLFAPLVETEELAIGEVGIGVTFKIHVDRSFKLEGRDVKRVETKIEDAKENDAAKIRKPRRSSNIMEQDRRCRRDKEQDRRCRRDKEQDRRCRRDKDPNRRCRLDINKLSIKVMEVMVRRMVTREFYIKILDMKEST